MPLLLLIAFLGIPLLELWVIGQVGGLIGLGPTILLLLVDSIAGAWLVRREGTRTWRRFTGALRSGRIPAEEVTDGALILFGGALLLTPGFVTDAVGLACVLPPTRAGLGRAIRKRVAARVTVFGRGFNPLRGRRGRTGGPVSPGPAADQDEVVDVEILDVQREGRRQSGSRPPDER